MAVTKIWTIKDSLQRVLDYAANPDKTEYDALAQTLHYAENDAKTKLSESAQLVTGIHCRPDHAWEDMRAVQERFGKTDGVVALHAYQSFREGEVTPEQCHEIGVALARKVWGKRFQVLVATHMNTDNSTKETTAPHQPPGTGAHLERYRENPCRTRFCPRPPVSILAGNCGLPQGLVPTGRNSSRTAGGNRQADAQKGCPAGTGRP